HRHLGGGWDGDPVHEKVTFPGGDLDARHEHEWGELGAELRELRVSVDGIVVRQGESVQPHGNEPGCDRLEGEQRIRRVLGVDVQVQAQPAHQRTLAPAGTGSDGRGPRPGPNASSSARPEVPGALRTTTHDPVGHAPENSTSAPPTSTRTRSVPAGPVTHPMVSDVATNS